MSFLKKVAAAWPGQQLHVVCDNYATHNHPGGRGLACSESQGRPALHATGCSWLNTVEIFFSIITRQAIRRGTYRSVKDLTARIGEFIDGWNERCQPFVWTKSADELLAEARNKETSRGALGGFGETHMACGDARLPGGLDPGFLDLYPLPKQVPGVSSSGPGVGGMPGARTNREGWALRALPGLRASRVPPPRGQVTGAGPAPGQAGERMFPWLPGESQARV